MSKFMTEVDSSDAASVTHHHDVGYDLENFDKTEVSIPEKYKCAVCKKVLENAIQFISDSNVPSRACHTCYMDTANTSNRGCSAARRDKAADNEIADLKLLCPNNRNGCTWSESLKFLEKHKLQCKYRSNNCHYCKQWVIGNDHEADCPEMPDACHQCHKNVMRKDLEDHQKSCQKRVEHCGCGEKFVPSEEPNKIQEHWTHQKKCLYSYIGCEIDELHDDESHEAVLVSKIIELKRDFITEKQKRERSDVKNKQLEVEVAEMSTKISVLLEQVDNLSRKYELVESLQKKVAKLEDKLSQPQFPVMHGARFIVSKRIDLLNSKVTHIENENLERNKALADMRNETLNGELLWNIDKLEFRMAQAKLGKVTALHSAPCYTKQYEYKYCVRLYLQGDGEGRGTHISIFFVIMKSEFDELLQWPMRKQVIIQLVNLRNEADSVIETFFSNTRSFSFERPAENMSVALEYPRLISIEQFLSRGFVKDNSAFIKVTVKDI